MRFLWLLPAWLLLTASLAAPQLVYFVSGRSMWLAGASGLVVIGLLAGLLLKKGPTQNQALVSLGICVVVAITSVAVGTDGYQRALALGSGRVLDGVALANLPGHTKAGTWVRITDARVRSDAAHELHFVSGDRNDPGSQTHSSITLAPLTLATAVPNESAILRGRLSGTFNVWACASRGMVSQWDSERQAVRGVLSPMDEDWLDSLRRKLRPAAEAPTPGAGAMPAAPGAWTPPPVAAVAALNASAQPWCVHLDHAVDAKRAREDALGTVLAFLLMVPLFLLGILAFVVTAPNKD